MSRKKLVIVESPTKANTIRRFLSKDYIVESCMGHIRDLPESAKNIPEKYKKKSWGTLGVNVEDNFQPIYCVPLSKKKVVENLKSKLKEAQELILATDEDREGESISWHLLQLLKPKVPIKRMVFHEITKNAIETALKNFRTIDTNLVQAQEARRVLDRLVGYSISPLLWKKIMGGLSAGRVQSLAVKLISDRELERLDFKKSNYSSLKATFKKKETFFSTLKTLESQSLAEGKDFNQKGELKDKKLLHLKEKKAQELCKKWEKETFTVTKLTEKPLSRSPKPPFITSTLQQAANRKLNLSSRQTMSIAQKLYENGFITYMRTDSTHLSKEALKNIRSAVTKLYGKKELLDKERIYKTKSKGAQEAHEAIRPSGTTEPEKTNLKGVELQLFKLIWKRTLASQMKNCEQKSVTILLSCENSIWSTSGNTITSPGFYKVYQDIESNETQLPTLKKGDKFTAENIEALSHSTQPPARYNEASLIQKLEKEGVGRPSTYASIISTIQDRGYIQKANKALAPTFTAVAVTQFLNEHFPNYLDLKFTSEMEETLDEIAKGSVKYEKYLSSIYKGEKGLKKQVETNESQTKEKNSRTFSLKPFKDIQFHVGRFGAYFSTNDNGKEITANIPQDLFPSDLNPETIATLIEAKKTEDKAFGVHPKTKEKIFIKTGRYGPYLETEESKKRGSLPAFLPVQDLTLDQAVQLLDLPQVLGVDPKTKKEIKKSIGKFGPYIVHDGDFRSVAKDETFFELDLKKALELLSQPKVSGKKRSSQKPLKEFKEGKETIQILTGRYGPYIRFKKKNINIPNSYDPENLTLESSLEIIEAKTQSGSKKSPAKKAAPKKKKKAK